MGGAKKLDVSLGNPAGGLLYHYRALRFRSPLWKSHLEGVELWLKTWPFIKEGPLILVGPSAGYSLPEFFLEFWDEFFLIEPDPLARFFLNFKLKQKTKKIKWHKRLEDIDLKQLPHAPVLFCNLLGQLELLSHHDSRLTRQFKNVIQQITQTRSWGSYHDRYSGFTHSSRLGFAVFDHRASESEMIEHFFDDSTEREINDHQVENWIQLPEHQTYAYWGWNLTPKAVHMIEAVYSKLLTQNP